MKIKTSMLGLLAAAGLALPAVAQQAADPYPVATRLANDVDKATYAHLQFRYAELSKTQEFDHATVRGELTGPTQAIVQKLVAVRGVVPSMNAVCRDLIGTWHTMFQTQMPPAHQLQDMKPRAIFRTEINVACNQAALKGVLSNAQAYGAMMAEDVTELAVTSETTRPDWACVNEKDRGHHSRWFLNKYLYEQRVEVEAVYKECRIAIKTVIDRNLASIKEKRETIAREIERKSEEDLAKFKLSQAAEQRRRDADREVHYKEATARAREFAEKALTLSSPDKPIRPLEDICVESIRILDPQRKLDDVATFARQECMRSAFVVFKPEVDRRLAPFIEPAALKTRTAQGVRGSDLIKIPDVARDAIGRSLDVISMPAYAEAIRPILLENFKQIERRVTEAYEGKVIADAAIFGVRRNVCQSEWTGDALINKAFREKCERYEDSLAATACETSLKSANSAKLGRSNMLVALSGKMNAREFDFDKLVCSAAQDGFTVEISAGLFSATTISIAPSTNPKLVLRVVLEKADNHKRKVWTADRLSDTTEDFATGYDVLSCFQKPMWERNVEILFKGFVAMLGGLEGPLETADPLNFGVAAINGAFCSAGKRKLLGV